MPHPRPSSDVYGKAALQDIADALDEFCRLIRNGRTDPDLQTERARMLSAARARHGDEAARFLTSLIDDVASLNQRRCA